MLCIDAFVSGSLGRAIFRTKADGDWDILNSPNSEPRFARHNEIYVFRHMAREVAPVDPEGLPVQIARVRSRLGTEILFFKTLDGLLVGMDPDMPEKVRRQAISRARGGPVHRRRYRSPRASAISCAS